MSRRLLSSGGALFGAVLAAALFAGCATAVNDAIDDGLTPGDDGTGITSNSGDAGKKDAGSYYGQPDTGGGNVGDDAGSVSPDPDSGAVVPPDSGTIVPDSGTVVPDSGTVVPDSGTVVPDSGTVVTTCPPGSLASFTTKYHAPDTNGPGSCTASEIAQFYTACLDPVNSTQAACTSYQNGIGGLFCSPCLVTPSTASKWGPLVQYPDNTVSLNSGGCYAISASAALSCGQQSEYVVECDRAACAACSTANGDFDSCATAAEAAGCSQYAQSETTQCAPYASTGCALSGTFESSFKSIAAVMCGP